MKNYAIDLARNVLRRKREDGGTDDGTVYDAMGNVVAPAISYDQPEEKKKELVDRAQEIAQPIERVYDPMGNVAVPAAPAPEGAKEGAYDNAMKKIGAAGEAVGAPIAKGLQTTADDYRKNLAHHTQFASELQAQANKDASGERGWQGRVLAPLQSANAMMATGFAPVSAAFQTLNHGATYLTGNPEFGNRLEFAAGFLDPSHIGQAKNAFMQIGKAAEEVAPYSAMFIPASATDPAAIAAKQMRAEGKTAEEIHKETGIWHGPESSFPSYELEPSRDDPSKMQRVGYMPEKPEPRAFKEISDEGLKLNRDTSNDRILNPRTGEAIESYSLEHPELLPHLPELNDLHVDIKVHPDFHPQGRFKEWEETYDGSGKWAPVLEVRASSPEEARIIAAHELQHFVSSKMGLETGNSEKNINLVRFHEQITSEAKQAAAQAKSEIGAYVDPKIQDYAEHYGVDANSANGRMTLDDLRKGLENEWWANLRQTDPEKADQILRANYINQHVKTPYELYQHMYGEAMARAVEERLNLSRAERGLTPIKYNYHEYGRAGQPDVLHPIPEKYLFSDENLADSFSKRMESGDFYRAGEAQSSRQPTVPAEVKAPQGNLNFQASELAGQLKGPEKQTVQSFLDQIKRKEGFTADSVAEIADKFPDKNAVVTKAEFESAVSQSKYNKEDLKTQREIGDVNEHIMDEAHDAVMMDIDTIYGDVMDIYGIKYNPQNLQLIRDWETGEVRFSDLPAEVQEAINKNTPKGTSPDQHFDGVVQEIASERIQQTYDEMILLDENYDPSRMVEGYKHQNIQRLLEDPAGTGDYFEFAVTHPDQKVPYKHYGEFKGENGNPVSHVRGSFLPEGGKMIAKGNPPQAPNDFSIPRASSLAEAFPEGKYYNAKPNSMLIEEIQADIQKVQGKEQTGVTRHSHGVAFKAAIQHALEGGASTVYMPTSGPIAAVRHKDPKQFKSIYDEQIVKEGINPLKEIPGVSVKKVADGAYWEIDFNQEAAQHILKGKGQRTPGFKTGGVVQRAMDISRFGTDAVQSAVNKARQHRRRPENS